MEKVNINADDIGLVQDLKKVINDLVEIDERQKTQTETCKLCGYTHDLFKSINTENIYCIDCLRSELNNKKSVPNTL